MTDTIIQDIWASGKWRPLTVDIISHGVHPSSMTCGNLENDFGKWNVASPKACTHWSWCVWINLLTFALANVKKHQPMHVHFGPVTLANGKLHHPKPSRLKNNVCIISRRYFRVPMVGHFKQGLCSLVKNNQQRASDISRTILVMDFFIGRGLCTSLSHQV